MGIIEGAGHGHPYTNAGAPSAGTDEVQSVATSGTPTGGTFKLAFYGKQTAAIAYNAAAAAVQSALEAVETIGSGNVTCGGGALGTAPVTVTFGAALGKLNVPMLTLADNSLTGGTTPTVAITETTPGVAATARGAQPGALLVDTTNKKLYMNSGTAQAPTWQVVGTQS